MTRNLFISMVFVMISGIIATPLSAQRTVDARQMFVPVTLKTQTSVQQTGFARPVMMQHAVARSIFDLAEQRITLTNFPLVWNENATLVLERTRGVVDANTEFYTHTKQGKVAMKVRPVISYRGTVNGDPSTKVSIHYSDGNVTGFVQSASGQRTVIGRDYSLGRQADATLHTIADEAVMFGVDPLSRFVCGNEQLPVDMDKAAQQMSIPAKAKAAEGAQNDYLREFKIAVVLREDIDSVMKRRGDTDEEVAQYFIKVVAAMAQVYEQELDAMLYMGYFEKYTTDEPSGYFYDGRDPGELLSEFSLDWSRRMNNVDRTVAHLYALIRPVGGSFVGGIAYLNGLCNKKHRGGYGVSTVYLNANEIPGDPNRSNAFVWDVFVAAHEMGHNIGAFHTHNCFWSPPVDTCQLSIDGTDGCYSTPSLRRVVPGTIMSYCHLANGSRTPLTFGTRVAERMRGWIAASSCAPFVTKPTVTITEPRGTDAYSLGEKMTIRWVSARVSALNLAWGPTASGPWTTFAPNVNAADRQYLWSIPALGVTTFWVRAEDASNPAVNDTSLASYRISIPVTLDAPKGGERLGQGSSYTIRWTKGQGVGNVKVEFSPDGTAWEVLQESSSATSFAWTVPPVTTENARIKVSALSAPNVPSTSQPFAIGARRFALEIPAENGSICKNQPNQYRWSADFIPSIRIQYSTDAGANWRTATQQSTVETVLWQIFSRNVNMNNVQAGITVQLRVIDAQSEEVLATRNALRLDSCDAPVSVQEDAAMAGFVLQRVSPNPATTTVRLDVSAAMASSDASVVLIATDGRELVLRTNIALQQGVTTLEIPLTSVAAGSYQIGVRMGSRMIVAPLAIVR